MKSFFITLNILILLLLSSSFSAAEAPEDQRKFIIRQVENSFIADHTFTYKEAFGEFQCGNCIDFLCKPAHKNVLLSNIDVAFLLEVMSSLKQKRKPLKHLKSLEVKFYSPLGYMPSETDFELCQFVFTDLKLIMPHLKRFGLDSRHMNKLLENLDFENFPPIEHAYFRGSYSNLTPGLRWFGATDVGQHIKSVDISHNYLDAENFATLNDPGLFKKLKTIYTSVIGE